MLSSQVVRSLPKTFSRVAVHSRTLGGTGRPVQNSNGNTICKLLVNNALLSFQI